MLSNGELHLDKDRLLMAREKRKLFLDTSFQSLNGETKPATFLVIKLPTQNLFHLYIIFDRFIKTTMFVSVIFTVKIRRK